MVSTFYSSSSGACLFSSFLLLSIICVEYLMAICEMFSIILILCWGILSFIRCFDGWRVDGAYYVGMNYYWGGGGAFIQPCSARRG